MIYVIWHTIFTILTYVWIGYKIIKEGHDASPMWARSTVAIAWPLLAAYMCGVKLASTLDRIATYLAGRFK